MSPQLGSFFTLDPERGHTRVMSQTKFCYDTAWQITILLNYRSRGSKLQQAENELHTARTESKDGKYTFLKQSFAFCTMQ